MYFWLYQKFIFQKRIFFEPTTLFSLLGIVSWSGFFGGQYGRFQWFHPESEKFHHQCFQEISVFFRRGSRIGQPEEVAEKIREASSQVKELLAFASVEILVAESGRLSAVLLQGMDWETTGEHG